MKIIERPSPNFDQRAGAGVPDILLMHYTGMQSLIEGDLLEPQPLIVAGREVLAPATLASAPGLLANAATSDEWSSGRAALPDPETPENVERLRAAAATIPAAKAKGCTRDIYRNVIWAIASTGWGCAEEIARGCA